MVSLISAQKLPSQDVSVKSTPSGQPDGNAQNGARHRNADYHDNRLFQPTEQNPTSTTSKHLNSHAASPDRPTKFRIWNP